MSPSDNPLAYASGDAGGAVLETPHTYDMER